MHFHRWKIIFAEKNVTEREKKSEILVIWQDERISPSSTLQSERIIN